jgi:hypothetical protein
MYLENAVYNQCQPQAWYVYIDEILSYRSEICGLHKADGVENIHARFCKHKVVVKKYVQRFCLSWDRKASCTHYKVTKVLDEIKELRKYNKNLFWG